MPTAEAGCWGPGWHTAHRNSWAARHWAQGCLLLKRNKFDFLDCKWGGGRKHDPSGGSLGAGFLFWKSEDKVSDLKEHKMTFSEHTASHWIPRMMTVGKPFHATGPWLGGRNQFIMPWFLHQAPNESGGEGGGRRCQGMGPTMLQILTLSAPTGSPTHLLMSSLHCMVGTWYPRVLSFSIPLSQ